MFKRKLTRRYVRLRIKCTALWLKKKPWIAYAIKHKLLLYVTNISLVIRIVWMTHKYDKLEIESKKDKELVMYYLSESNALRKVYSDIPVSISEKKKIGKIFLMMSTNDYYNFQFLNEIGLEGYDYLGLQDEQIQDSTSSQIYNFHDAIVSHKDGREWFREPFISNLDTIPLAAFKASRIEYNNDTIVIGLYFNLDKLKRELNLKDNEKD